MLMLEAYAYLTWCRPRWRSTDERCVTPKDCIGSRLIAEHDFKTLEEARAEYGDLIAARTGSIAGDETLQSRRLVQIQARWK